MKLQHSLAALHYLTVLVTRPALHLLLFRLDLNLANLVALLAPGQTLVEA